MLGQRWRIIWWGRLLAGMGAVLLLAWLLALSLPAAAQSLDFDTSRLPDPPTTFTEQKLWQEIQNARRNPALADQAHKDLADYYDSKGYSDLAAKERTKVGGGSSTQPTAAAPAPTSRPGQGSATAPPSSATGLTKCSALPKVSQAAAAAGVGQIVMTQLTGTGANFQTVDSNKEVVDSMTLQAAAVTSYDPQSGMVARFGGVSSADHLRLRNDGGAATTVRGAALSLLDAKGGSKQLTTRAGADDGVPAAVWSPDGRFLAYQGLGAGSGYSWTSGELYILDTQTGATCYASDPVTNGITIRDVRWLPERGLVVSTKDSFYWIDTDLTFRKLPVKATNLNFAGAFDIAPDGSLIAWSGTASDGSSQIWVSQLDGNAYQSLTEGAKVSCLAPHFSPDSKYIAFIVSGNGARNLWIMPADGSDAAPLFDGDGNPIGSVATIEQWVPANDLSAWLGR